jgi:hypothetical protein
MERRRGLNQRTGFPAKRISKFAENTLIRELHTCIEGRLT